MWYSHNDSDYLEMVETEAPVRMFVQYRDECVMFSENRFKELTYDNLCGGIRRKLNHAIPKHVFFTLRYESVELDGQKIILASEADLADAIGTTKAAGRTKLQMWVVIRDTPRCVSDIEAVADSCVDSTNPLQSTSTSIVTAPPICPFVGTSEEIEMAVVVKPGPGPIVPKRRSKKHCTISSSDGGYDFDVFLSYRVWCDKDVVEKMYWVLTAKGLRVFWDKKCLAPGASWESGFADGLQRSRRIVVVASESSLQGMASSALAKKQDNLLKEWELAVDKLSSDSKCIVPVLVGVYKHGGGLFKFDAFGGLDDQPWPAECSASCGTRTIKDTMEKLFSIQGIHLDPGAVDLACDLVQGALS
jgi:hypothetical protein